MVIIINVIKVMDVIKIGVKGRKTALARLPFSRFASGGRKQNGRRVDEGDV